MADFTLIKKAHKLFSFNNTAVFFLNINPSLFNIMIKTQKHKEFNDVSTYNYDLFCFFAKFEVIIGL